eukprot:PLAT3614.13.p1 GENE.PLAT3614.13~~PLAT3614.13.p1  ORF type:complete len:680 (+),score=260.43 PLAT3614.13:67-2106(+)
MSPGKPSKVWRYAREGKVSKLESYLERHPDVDLNWQNDDEKKAKTAVMVAGGHDHLASMRLLLDKGASPTIVVSYKGDERTCYGYFLSKSHPKVDSVVELVKRRIHPVTKQDKQLFIAKAREIATAGGAEIAEQMKEIMAALAGEAGVSVSMQGAHVMRIAGGGAGGAGGFPVPPGFPEGSDPRQLFQQAHELVTSGEASSMEEALKSLGVKMGGTVIVSGGSGTKFTMSASSPAAGASDDDGSDDEKSAGLKRAKPSRSDEKKRKGDDRDAAPARPAMSKMMSADDEDDDDDDGGPINAADEMTETSAELWNAAKDGNLITVRAILSVGGADLEYLNGTRAGKEGTALMISMARRHMEVGELLLNAGASMRTTTTVTHKEKKSKRSRRPRRDHHVSVVGYVLSYKKEYTSAARLLELGAKLNTPDDRELAKEYADKILSKATRMEWTRAVRVMLELIDAEGLSISGGLDDARKLVAAADEAEATEEAEEDAAAAAPAPAAPAPAAPAPAPAPTPAGGGGGGGGGSGSKHALRLSDAGVRMLTAPPSPPPLPATPASGRRASLDAALRAASASAPSSRPTRHTMRASAATASVVAASAAAAAHARGGKSAAAASFIYGPKAPARPARLPAPADVSGLAKMMEEPPARAPEFRDSIWQQLADRAPPARSRRRSRRSTGRR